jgi:hypothetical protein
MMIKIDPTHLDGIVRACLKDSLETAQWAIDSDMFDPIELKDYKKITKAMKLVLKYFGEA